MKRTYTPRRRRARLKAWVYLALFGPGDETADPTSDSTSDTGDEGDTTDGRTREG